MTNCFQMVFERFLINGHTFQCHSSLFKRKSVAFNGIGVVCELNHKLVSQTFHFTGSEWAHGGEFFFFIINFHYYVVLAATTVKGFECSFGNHIQFALTNHTLNLAFGT